MDSNKQAKKTCVQLTGDSLTPEDLMALSNLQSSIEISAEAWKKVDDGRLVIDNILKEGTVAYGINTGFGLFSNVTVNDEQLVELQENLVVRTLLARERR